MVVKKAIVIFLLVLYTASSIGATINMHYCMDKFAGLSFSDTKKDKCPKCGMTNSGCCKDKKKQIKLSLDQQQSDFIKSVKWSAPILISNIVANPANDLAVVSTKYNLVYVHAPPLLLYKNGQAFFATFLI